MIVLQFARHAGPSLARPCSIAARPAIIAADALAISRPSLSRSHPCYVLIAALAAGLGLFVAAALSSAARWHASRRRPPRATRRACADPQPRALPAFALTHVGWPPATRATLRGAWTLVFLGFTHCPDVCPTTLAELAGAEALGRPMPAAIRPRVLFVSVDPERDTPAGLATTRTIFQPDTLAATGDPAALADFARSLGIVFMKVPLPGGDYTDGPLRDSGRARSAGTAGRLIRPPLGLERHRRRPVDLLAEATP